MLSQEATAMTGLSGNNLGTILTLIVDLVGVITLAYISISSDTDYRISFAWKLGLVAVGLMPMQILAGYFRFAMQKKLSDALRKAYARSADMACEQVAAIRTVASLNREPYIIQEFEKSLEQPVHEAMMKTLKSTGVCALMLWNTDGSFMRLVWVTSYFRWLLYFGMEVCFWRTRNATSRNFLSRMVLHWRFSDFAGLCRLPSEATWRV